MASASSAKNGYFWVGLDRGQCKGKDLTSSSTMLIGGGMRPQEKATQLLPPKVLQSPARARHRHKDARIHFDGLEDKLNLAKNAQTGAGRRHFSRHWFRNAPDRQYFIQQSLLRHLKKRAQSLVPGAQQGLMIRTKIHQP